MLGIPHSLKYEFNSGLGLRECARAIREISGLPIGVPSSWDNGVHLIYLLAT